MHPASSESQALQRRIARQAEQLPAMYGRIDFGALPERFTLDPAQRSALDVLHAPPPQRRAALLANQALVERIRAYTLHGDPVADAYACLIPQRGFRRLVAMLVQACQQGVSAVADAPPELAAFLHEMEQRPDWIDMALVEEGARASRNVMAHLAPLIIRGAFFGTFTNKYAALPMALTGALSHETAGRRVLETASFFTVTTLPGALARHGAGFQAAAMVRLMHAMVRFHALTKPGQWDPAVFGLPIPQVDQMPAGLKSSYLLASKALKAGRDFTRSERAQVELARYRCFLLGLPAELLPATPRELVDVLDTRSATLRDGYDDATCGALIRSTMAADLGRDAGLLGRLRSLAEPSTAKLYFVRNYFGGDQARAAAIGIRVRPLDRAWHALGLLSAALPLLGYALAQRIGPLRALAERRLVRKVEALLRRYGHAEFTTDATAYRPTVKAPT